MKLAEALSLRKDLEKRISDLKERLEIQYESRKVMNLQRIRRNF